MDAGKLQAIEIPNNRFVVRVKGGGPRLGTVFSTDQGWCWQFDGTDRESDPRPDFDEALAEMEAAAQRGRAIRAEA